MKCIILIPARGGSVGVPRKNVRLLNGKPLILYTIETVNKLKESSPVEIHPYVMSDDEEILYVSERAGVKVVKEPKTTGKATLDDVTLNFLSMIDIEINENDIFLTIQPTCPFVKAQTILKAYEAIKKSSGSVLTVSDDRHLSWTINKEGKPQKNYKERLNRQMLPPEFRESGAVIGSMVKNIQGHKTRIVEPINLIEVDKEEGIDIDDFYDWSMAEYVATKKTIIIRTDAAKEMGMGHVYRSLAFAQELAEHKIIFYVDKNKPLGLTFLEQFPFEVRSGSNEDFLKVINNEKPYLTVLDMLNTELDFTQKIKENSDFLVTFEDLGPGAKNADLVISDLYKNNDISDDKQLSGIENAILAPSFETLNHNKIFKDNVENILVLFGGTDPSNLTEIALEALSQINFKGQVTAILGPGRVDRSINHSSYNLDLKILENVSYIPKYMYEADMALSSAGRTITELVDTMVPTVCLCQNAKEVMHTHANEKYGVLNLGLGKELKVEELAKELNQFISDKDKREAFFSRQFNFTNKRSNKKIVKKIKDFLSF